MKSRVLVAGVLAALSVSAVAAEWQWSVAVPSVTSDETHQSPRAFLWIPPTCSRVRAVVIGQHNMLEEPLFENPVFRKTLSELGVAEVWISPILCGQAEVGAREAAQFDDMLRLLAEVSGYDELARVPVVPLGHSAMADFPYLFGAQCPGRTLAAISLKGSWPDMKRVPLTGTGERLRGVPLLLVSGEYEWADERAGKSLAFRRAYPSVPFSMLSDAGGGHFDMHDDLAAFLGAYLRSAVQARLDGGSDVLRAVDPTRQGWLVDRWRQNKPPRAQAASVADYTGDKDETFWCFDEAQARATEARQAAYANKKMQLLGYRQAGVIVEQNPKLHAQVELAFKPAADGVTFELEGAFLDTVPAGRPERWSGLTAGTTIGHASGGGPVCIERICGPVKQLGPTTFALDFYRMGMDNVKRSNEIWLMATHPGDALYKRSVQQAVLHIPLRNAAGRPQAITFPPIADQRADVETVPLVATSDAGGPVSYYVREGPAEVVGHALRITPLPPRTKFPVRVTVVAWQYGRGVDPKLQSATPVERTFLITR